MPDGSHILLIDGKPLRAFTPEKVEEFANRKDALEVCKANEVRTEDRLKIAAQNVTIAEQQRDIEKGNFARAMAMYEKERELRIESSQFIPHGKVGGVGGKLFNFLDGPYGQSLFKLVIPTATFIKTVRQ